MSGLSQMSSQQMSLQMSEKSDATSGWYSEDSQSLGQPNGAFPPMKPIPPDKMYPPSFPQVKRPKYKGNLPNWTKGLIKTAEENQKLKNHDALLRQQKEDHVHFKTFILDVQKTIAIFPELLSQMIKQSTDFLSQKYRKQNEWLREEMLKDMNDSFTKKMSEMKEHLRRFPKLFHVSGIEVRSGASKY